MATVYIKSSNFRNLQPSNPKNRTPNASLRLLSLDEQDSNAIKVKKYFQSIIMKQKVDNFIRVPSIKALLGFLNVTIEDFMIGLQELSRMGFDYEILNNGQDLIVWDSLLMSKYDK